MSTHFPRTSYEAHREAKSQDARNQYTQGDQLDVVIAESPEQNNGRHAVTRIGQNRLVVFVTPGRLTLHQGDCVRVKVKEVFENRLDAVALARLE